MPSSRSTSVLILILLVAAFASQTQPAAATQNAALWIDPPEQGAGATFTARVMQHADVATTAAQASISFDRTLLQVLDVQPGAAYTGASLVMGIAPQTKQDAIGEANNASGRLWSVATYFAPDTGSVPAGDAAFLLITFAPVGGAIGISELRRTRTSMLDANYDELTGVWLTSGRVAVGDVDSDGISGPADNCPFIANAGQANADGNLIDLTPPEAQDDTSWINSDNAGDACDSDADNDGLVDTLEAAIGPGGANHASCPGASGNTNPLLLDSDGDRVTDGAECALGTDPLNASSKPSTTQCAAHLGVTTNADTDADGIKDYVEYCRFSSNPVAADTDGDGLADNCEAASVDGNNAVTQGDLNIVAAHMSSNPAAPAYRLDYDTNRDGAINSGDLSFVSSQQLACP